MLSVVINNLGGLEVEAKMLQFPPYQNAFPVAMGTGLGMLGVLWVGPGLNRSCLHGGRGECLLRVLGAARCNPTVAGAQQLVGKLSHGLV